MEMPIIGDFLIRIAFQKLGPIKARLLFIYRFSH